MASAVPPRPGGLASLVAMLFAPLRGVVAAGRDISSYLKNRSISPTSCVTGDGGNDSRNRRP